MLTDDKIVQAFLSESQEEEKLMMKGKKKVKQLATIKKECATVSSIIYQIAEINSSGLCDIYKKWCEYTLNKELNKKKQKKVTDFLN